MLEFFANLFSSKNFMPHGHCYLWRPEILWLHVISDAIIALAYASIPFALGYLVRKRKDLAFNWVFVMFGLFILACGATHLISIWTVWEPIYRLDGLIKAVTAMASIGTAVALWPLIPKVIVMPSSSQLEEANRGLHLEIVERKRAEKQLEARNIALREAERLKSDFIANVSHELRTPLTLILSPLESLLNQHRLKGGPSPAWKESDIELLGLAHNNAIRLLQMINGLLDFSKLEAKKTEVKREAIDFPKLVARINADFAPVMEAKDIALEAELDLEDPVRELDAYLFERILFNLLSNAAKFTPAGGKVHVSLSQAGDERIIIKVKDSGVGISADDRPHLFEKFRQLEGSSTRRFEGTGLGLALVKEFSELLGGRVTVESQPGEGSTFIVNLLAPAAAREASSEVILGPSRSQILYPVPEHASQGLSHDADSSKENLPLVLIAEDNADLASYIAATLSGICRTAIAADGVEALQLAKHLQPQLVMSDVMMPNMDGYSLCVALKQNEATLSTPVLMLTALTHREALLRGWEVGADEYLFKPFHPTELLTRVKSLLKSIEIREKAEARREELAAVNAQKAAVEAHVEKLSASEAELKRLNRIKDEFLATVSHELRTPMVAILGWSELLAANEIEPEEFNDAFETIYRNAKSQVRIIDDLLDISRMMNGHFVIELEPVQMKEVIRGAIATVQNAAAVKNISLVLQLEDVGPVAGDADRLKQLIWNLLSNAIKFSPTGKQVEVFLREDAGQVHFIVKDHGKGITSEFLPHVFERFLQEDQSSTRRQGGLGLGLSIVKHITELHGGTIEAISAGRDQGSTFILHLPLRKLRSIESRA